MKAKVHDHLMFGEGVVDFADIFSALLQIEYSAPISVELSRHSHNAVEIATSSLAFLRQQIAAAQANLSHLDNPAG